MAKKKNRRYKGAKRAKAEAQGLSKNLMKKISYLGVPLTVSASTFSDIEFVDSMMQLEDSDTSDQDRVKAFFRVGKMLAGSKWNTIIAAIREENNGEAPMGELAKFIKTVSDEMSPERRAS